jgi:DNA-binding response OmpR family regulator
MKALIVDDDQTLADLLAFTLRKAGFEPHLAHSAPSAIEIFNQEIMDIIILDVNLPGEVGLRSGFDVCRRIRQTSDVPIILLTVRDDEDDIVQGLNLGADDYILKPFSPRQLVARVQSVLRRSKAGVVQSDAPYVYENISFEPSTRVFIQESQEPITLTKLEARLLAYLMLNQGQVLLAENIINHVWGPGGGSQEMLRQLIRRLRLKIEHDPSDPKYIKNLPEMGYGVGI